MIKKIMIIWISVGFEIDDSALSEVGFEKCFDEWISQSNFHRCMLFFLEEDIVQGEGSPLFRDAKMSKGNKVVLKSSEMTTFGFWIQK